MPKPGEHKTVQARILQYAQEIGWTFVPRLEAEKRRGISKDLTGLREASPKRSEGGRDLSGLGSLYFDNLLYSKAKEFNPFYNEAEGALVGQLRRLHSDIYGNREFLEYLRNKGKFFYATENRELDLLLIDYEQSERNIYEVTEEFYWHNGRFGNREDVVFLINGIPILVIECKNASKEEGIALGIDQVRRYHIETPEYFVPEMAFIATDALGFDYGGTWNTVKRNIFHWKHEQVGQLEAKVKSFFDIPRVLSLLKDYILFSEKDEELQKFILQQHQTTAVEQAVARAHDQTKRRGLITLQNE